MKVGDRVFNVFNDLSGTIVKINKIAGQVNYWVKPDAPKTHVFYEDELKPIRKCSICGDELTADENEKDDNLCFQCWRHEDIGRNPDEHYKYFWREP